MTTPGPIDFWFSIGSLYSYLSVMRLDRIALRRLHVRFAPRKQTFGGGSLMSAKCHKLP
jgi:2-hydroxychromene-2-carboxylate isomerase